MSMNKTVNRSKHRSLRKQRIERWAYDHQNGSIQGQILQTSTSAATSLEEQRVENSFIQADHQLKVELYRLGEQREKILEQHNFNQKLFANKQALRHKENPEIQSTLNYVRKCCKFSSMTDIEKRTSPELVRSRSVIKRTPKVKENEQIQLPIPINKRGSQSAHIISKSHSSMRTSSIKTFQRSRSINSAPPQTRISQRKKPIQIKRPSTRIFCTKSTLENFRHHPEQFLSSSNRYLPLLRRQATIIESHSKRKHPQSNSRCSEHSEGAFDEVKSFLSDDIGKTAPSYHAPSKINLMDTSIDNSSEYTLTLSRLRDRQYNHLQNLIRRTSSINDILKPFSPIKTYDKPIPPLTFHSINQEKQPKIIEKNFSKLSLLIF